MLFLELKDKGFGRCQFDVGASLGVGTVEVINKVFVHLKSAAVARYDFRSETGTLLVHYSSNLKLVTRRFLDFNNN